MIYGYMHCMLTEDGIRIYRDQLDSLIRSGLYSNCERITVGHVGVMPPNATYNSLRKLEYMHTKDIGYYEAFTLHELWRDALENDNGSDCIFYIHTKGATSGEANARGWRLSMENIVISRWKDCVSLLKCSVHPDVYGAHYFPNGDERFFIPGNFWWTTVAHIKTLMSPREWAIKSERYRTPLERYAYEDWITLGRRDGSRVKVSGAGPWVD